MKNVFAFVQKRLCIIVNVVQGDKLLKLQNNRDALKDIGNKIIT